MDFGIDLMSDALVHYLSVFLRFKDELHECATLYLLSQLIIVGVWMHHPYALRVHFWLSTSCIPYRCLPTNSHRLALSDRRGTVKS